MKTTKKRKNRGWSDGGTFSDRNGLQKEFPSTGKKEKF